jgi:hypothetical protein
VEALMTRRIIFLGGFALLLLLPARMLGQPRGTAVELRVGAAKVDITPEFPVGLAGYSNADRRISEGVHDRLYARAVAFRKGAKKLVLVSCDLSGFAYVPISYFRRDLLARFDLKPGELLLCGTHTHSAPMLVLNRAYPHPNNYAYTEGLKAKLLEAVSKAINSAAPALLGAGVGQSAVAVNRRLPLPRDQAASGAAKVTMGRNPDGPVDRDVLVLKAVRPGGGPVAALFSYACHARSLRAANRLVSGDIFGIAEQFTEDMLGPNVVTPGFAGASGDIDPWYVVDEFTREPGRIPETVLMGNLLGAEVVRVFRSVTDPAAGGEIETRWEHLALPGKAAGTPSPGARAPAKYLEMTAARVGEFAFFAVDCEALVEIGKAIRKQSPFRYTFNLTSCNGGSGYLPPAHLYAERGYEVDLSGFAAEAAGMVVTSALKMLSSLGR